jgi:hypothetical protein
MQNYRGQAFSVFGPEVTDVTPNTPEAKTAGETGSFRMVLDWGGARSAGKLTQATITVELPDNQTVDRSQRLYQPPSSETLSYDDDGNPMLRNEWNEWRGIDAESGNARGQEAMERCFARMWNISKFMKGRKQAFGQWYHATYQRVGTLWESRFKSTVAQGGDALLTVAAYIDLRMLRKTVTLRGALEVSYDSAIPWL